MQLQPQANLRLHILMVYIKRMSELVDTCLLLAEDVVILFAEPAGILARQRVVLW